MEPVDCLLKIMEDCEKIDPDKLDRLRGKKRDKEIEKIVNRWLKWISQVNRPSWELNDNSDAEEEE